MGLAAQFSTKVSIADNAKSWIGQLVRSLCARQSFYAADARDQMSSRFLDRLDLT
jgi:hypothetical protein